ncbi:GerAB/ArcD/ProY family transporter [Desulfitibacter alkalitolerans]|uniref:GerAB/ArcD/ProY family transporter n=1 Tax=Desulfitibacter alkalitolerans TaxID=264641 RepID=UPI0004898C6C|nr:endospore germination permease [Desulfitibacter alkalitolerans]
MVEKTSPISWLQASSIGLNAALGVGLITLSRATYVEAGQDSIFAIIIASIILLFTGMIFIKVGLLYPNTSIFTIIDLLMGKYVGFIIKLYYTAYLILLPTMTIRLFSEIVSESLLLTTPKVVVIGTMILAAGYLTLQGMQVLGRITLFLAPLIIIIPIGFLFISMYYHFEFLFLLPLMRHGIQELGRAALATGFSFTGFELIVFLLVYMQTPSEGYKAFALSLFFIFLVYFIVILAGISIFGDAIKELQWPTLEAIRIVNIPVDILQRVDGPFITIWIMAIFTTAAVFYALGVDVASQLFNINKNLLVFPTGIFMIWVALIPNTLMEAFQLSDWLGHMGIIGATIIPLLLYLVSLVKGRRLNGKS